MIKRSVAAAAVFSLGLATVAHASLTLGQPAPRDPQPPVQAEAALTPALAPVPAQPRPVPRAYTEVKNLAPLTQDDADERPGPRKAPPRVIALPRADAPNAVVPTPVRAPQAERAAPVRPVAAVQEPSVQEAVPVEPVAAPRRSANPVRRNAEIRPEPRPDRPAGYRSASWSGGEGATWKVGRNDYGFDGTFGGCRFTGFSGPQGFRLDRNCR